MKKIIGILTLSLASAFAFAITDAEKTVFLEKLKTDFSAPVSANDALGSAKKPFGDMLANTYSAMEEATEPIAKWAIEKPGEYLAFAGNNHIQWVVRYYIQKNGLIAADAQTPEQDAAIFDHSLIDKMANQDESVYKSVKAVNFMWGGAKIPSGKVFGLAKKWGDPEAYEAFPKEEIAKRFDDYLVAVAKWSANPNLDPAVRWNKYQAIELSYAFMKIERNGDGTLKYPKISLTWTDLQTASGAARTFYEWRQ